MDTDTSTAREAPRAIASHAMFTVLKSTPNAIVGSIGFALCVCALEAWRFPVVAGADFDGAPTMANIPAIVAFILAAGYYRFSRNRLLRLNATAIIFALAATVSLYARYSSSLASDLPAVFPILANMHLGFGTMLFVVWIEELCRKKATALVTAIWSLVCIAFFETTIGLVIEPMASGTCALLPILSVLCLILYRRQEAPIFPLTARGNPLGTAPSPTTARNRAARFAIVEAGACLLCCGVLFSYLHNRWSATEALAWPPLLIQVASALGALLMAIVAAVMLSRFNRGILEITILVFALLSLYFSTFESSEAGSALYLTFLNASQKAILILLLYMCVNQPRIKANMIEFCLLFACYRIGLSLVKFAMDLFPNFAEPSGQSQAFAVAVIILAACALHALFSQGQASTAPGTPPKSTRPKNEPSDARDDDRYARYHELAFYFYLAQDYSLTQREIEVLPLAVSGKNAAAIASELVITQATAKSHLRNIYAKMGVHSQKELSDLVDAERSHFA